MKFTVTLSPADIKEFNDLKSDPNGQNQEISKKKFLIKKTINFTQYLYSLNIFYKILSYSSIFFTSLTPGLSNSLYNSDNDESSLTTMLNKSATQASSSILGSTGPMMDFFSDWFPFIEFIINRKNNILFKEKNETLKSAFMTFIVSLSSIPLAMLFFDKLEKMTLINESSKYFKIYQLFCNFFRALTISTFMIAIGVVFHFYANYAEKKILDEKIHEKKDDSSYGKRIAFRIITSVLLIFAASHFIPLIQNYTINYLTSISAGAETILLANHMFTTLGMVFSIYCIMARLVYFVLRDIFILDKTDSKINPYNATLTAFALSVLLLTLKNFIDDKYPQEFFMKKTILHTILGLAIISIILFCGLIFKWKKNELEEKIDKTNSLGDLKTELESNGRNKLLISSLFSTIIFSAILYGTLNQIENNLVLNIIQNPIFISFIIFACLSCILEGVLELGAANRIGVIEEKFSQINTQINKEIESNKVNNKTLNLDLTENVLEILTKEQIQLTA